MTDSLRLWQTRSGEYASRVAGAGDLPSGPPSRLQLKQRRRGWRAAGSALVVVTIVGGIGVADAMRADRTGATGPPAAPGAALAPEQAEPPTPAQEPKLVGTEWQLVEFTRDGRTTAVPDELDSGLLFDGKGNYFLGACQGTSGNAVLDDRMVKLEGSTPLLCGITRFRRAWWIAGAAAEV
jgi:hypothetical protein